MLPWFMLPWFMLVLALNPMVRRPPTIAYGSLAFGVHFAFGSVHTLTPMVIWSSLSCPEAINASGGFCARTEFNARMSRLIEDSAPFFFFFVVVAANFFFWHGIRLFFTLSCQRYFYQNGLRSSPKIVCIVNQKECDARNGCEQFLRSRIFLGGGS